MFTAFLSTGTPQYVESYEVASIVQFNKLYANTPNVIFIKKTDFQGNALLNFIQNFNKYFLQNGKLVLNINM